MNLIEQLVNIAQEPDGAEKLQKFFVTGLMAIFIIIFVIYAIGKLLGF